MKNLEPPVKIHTSGRRPTHSSTRNLASNFLNLHPDALKWVLLKDGLISDSWKITEKAVEKDLIDRCGSTALWNLEKLQEYLKSVGMSVERQSVNQDLPVFSDNEPKWSNLSTVGTYFSVSAKQVGKWLEDLELKNPDGTPSQKAIDSGLSLATTMNAGGKKTRNITLWNLLPVLKAIKDAGHELDRDYRKILQGTGRNSDVSISSVDEKVKDLTKKFIDSFKNKNRSECVRLVESQPRAILERMEEKLKKPGFLTENTYKNFLR